MTSREFSCIAADAADAATVGSFFNQIPPSGGAGNAIPLADLAEEAEAKAEAEIEAEAEEAKDSNREAIEEIFNTEDAVNAPLAPGTKNNDHVAKTAIRAFLLILTFLMTKYNFPETDKSMKQAVLARRAKYIAKYNNAVARLRGLAESFSKKSLDKLTEIEKVIRLHGGNLLNANKGAQPVFLPRVFRSPRQPQKKKVMVDMMAGLGDEDEEEGSAAINPNELVLLSTRTKVIMRGSVLDLFGFITSLLTLGVANSPTLVEWREAKVQIYRGKSKLKPNQDPFGVFGNYALKLHYEDSNGDVHDLYSNDTRLVKLCESAKGQPLMEMLCGPIVATIHSLLLARDHTSEKVFDGLFFCPYVIDEIPCCHSTGFLTYIRNQGNLVPIVKCSQGHAICTGCKKQQHIGMCESIIARIDPEVWSVLENEQNTKQCPYPGCGSIVTKNGGCMHMHGCSADPCHSFCWTCLAIIPEATWLDHYSSGACGGLDYMGVPFVIPPGVFPPGDFVPDVDVDIVIADIAGAAAAVDAGAEDVDEE